MKSLILPPVFIRKIFKRISWTTSNNKILLTFDDSPNPETTPVILEYLEQQNLHALFFCVGDNLRKYPGLAKKIISAGHLIGNHTQHHTNLLFSSKSLIREEIDAFNKTYYELFGEKPIYFRPPYGKFRMGLQKELDSFGLKNVMWSLLTYDYKNDLNIVKFAIANYLRNDSIIVFHDSNKCKNIIINSLEFLLDETFKKGYVFGEPTECLK